MMLYVGIFGNYDDFHIWSAPSPLEKVPTQKGPEIKKKNGGFFEVIRYELSPYDHRNRPELFTLEYYFFVDSNAREDRNE